MGRWQQQTSQTCPSVSFINILLSYLFIHSFKTIIKLLVCYMCLVLELILRMTSEQTVSGTLNRVQCEIICLATDRSKMAEFRATSLVEAGPGKIQSQEDPNEIVGFL